MAVECSNDTWGLGGRIRQMVNGPGHPGSPSSFMIHLVCKEVGQLLPLLPSSVSPCAAEGMGTAAWPSPCCLVLAQLCDGASRHSYSAHVAHELVSDRCV